MGKFCDLTGQRFGHLTVLKRATEKGTKVKWLCKCDCGNETVVCTGDLKNGSTKSCGCYNHQLKYDLTGKKFGMLTATERSTNNTYGRTTWLCKCDCGNEIITDLYSLIKGKVSNCGCVHLPKRAKNLKGQRFGRLTVIEYAGKNKHGITMWVCKCDCGNEKIIASNSLTGGSTSSCGCYRSERIKKIKHKPLKNLIGQKFGRWTVLSEAPRENNEPRWLCKCECGNEKVVSHYCLLNGSSTSCGCFCREQASNRCKALTKDLTGQKFGMLTAIRIDDNPNNKRVKWLCKCDCGGTLITDAHSLISGKTMSCGCMHSFNESIIKKELKKLNIPFENEKKFSNLLGEKGKPLRFDFAVYDNCGNVIFLLEYQGSQHYENTEFGKPQREITDKRKRDWCKLNNIPLEEITYKNETLPALYNILNKYMLIPCQAS